MSLFSLQVEKHALGGLIQHPDVIADFHGIMQDTDFVAQPHSVIYSCLVKAYLNKEKIDKVLIAQSVKNLGISFKDKINIFDYIEAISFTTISADATRNACAELIKYRICRNLAGTCDDIKLHLERNINSPVDQLIAQADSLYGQQVNTFTLDSGEKNLFAGVLDAVEERGNNPIEEVGFATPWPEFNRFYGGLRRKNLYIIASRAKAGKSTFLNEAGSEMSKMHNMEVLYLDTEMSTEETTFRAAAAKSGVPLWYLETGNWRKNADMVKKVRSALKDLSGYKVTHQHIGNKSMDEIKAMARRWYLRKVGRGNKCLIIYDYLKIVEMDGNQKEYQLMGDIVDALKRLSEELDCPVVTACQSNREGITQGRSVADLQDNAASIGLSDRITWYATYVGLFRRRVAEEIVLDTPESGTHKLIEIVARHQGRDAAGHQDMIKRVYPDGSEKYVQNFINFNINNFKVEECGSLVDCIQRQHAQHLVADPHQHNAPVHTV